MVYWSRFTVLEDKATLRSDLSARTGLRETEYRACTVSFFVSRKQKR